MQNPFTTTFSKLPGLTYIQQDDIADILENFSYDSPSESVYKITGVRGSGKTVMLAKLESELLSGDIPGDWVVCRLSPARDMLQQMASRLQSEPFAKRKRRKNIKLAAEFLIAHGEVDISPSDGMVYDVGVELEKMLGMAGRACKKVFIGIDEVSRTREMVEFASEYGKWLRAGYPVFLVCTGLYNNIVQLSDVPNLTFFKRATTIRTKPLNFIKMSEIYRNFLNIDGKISAKLARTTLGYPYAFQKLGALLFSSPGCEYGDATAYLKGELFSYAYEKIWEELSNEERKILHLLEDGEPKKRKDIIQDMENPGNYPVYRDRLIRKGILSGNSPGYGYVSLTLPFFHEYMREYTHTVF